MDKFFYTSIVLLLLLLICGGAFPIDGKQKDTNVLTTGSEEQHVFVTHHAAIDNKKVELIEKAYSVLKTPHVYGGTSPNGFDCSGFTAYVFKHALDIQLPRSSADQAKVGELVDISNASIGDLVFFQPGNRINHVGIITSQPEEPLTMIHVSSSNGVEVTNIEESTYWQARLLYVRTGYLK